MILWERHLKRTRQATWVIFVFRDFNNRRACCSITHKPAQIIFLSVVILYVFCVSVIAAPQNIAMTPVSRLDQAWWHRRFDQKAQELRSVPVNLLWLGDSITQNWELDGPESWRNFAPIWKRFYGDRRAINLGFKGDSTCHLLWRLQHGELSGVTPKGIILLIGANNFGHIHTNAAETAAGIRVIIDEIHERLPMAHILLLSVLPSIRSNWISYNTVRLDLTLPQLVAHQRSYITYVDLSSLFLHNGKVDKTKFLDPKLVPPEPPLHPTAQTQEQIAIAIEPLVARMLGDNIHH